MSSWVKPGITRKETIIFLCLKHFKINKLKIVCRLVDPPLEGKLEIRNWKFNTILSPLSQHNHQSNFQHSQSIPQTFRFSQSFP